MPKNRNGILAKMLAAFARDAEPEEIEEAVEAIDEITSEPAKEELPPVPEKVEDEGPDKMDMILDKLDQIIGSKDCGTKDEEPEEDPLQKLEDDLDELEKAAPVVEEEVEEKEEDEEPMNPEDDPDEPEAHFVDPEEINEEDEDPEEIEEEQKEDIPVVDKRACDAARVALNVLKPVIAKLPPSERKKAADAAVAQIRKSSGMDEKPKKNDYMALKKRPKKSSYDSALEEAEIGRRIMESRNPNYKK